MVVSYNGQPFCGFARQEGLLTVQGEIEYALLTIFRRQIETVCAGRTDSGVHARGQVVSADLLSSELENKTLESLQRSLNALTHDSISIRKIVIAPTGFSARFDADWREYRYRFSDGSNRPLFSKDFTWCIESARSLNIDAMQQGAQYLLGEHDFKSFCVSASAVGKNTNRCINSIDIYEERVLGEHGYVLKVVGNAFLHSMIRTMMGTLMEVACNRKSPEWIPEVLAATDRSKAGQTAPAKGLIFWRVKYENLPEASIDD